jgi:hypothetical protein
MAGFDSTLSDGFYAAANTLFASAPFLHMAPDAVIAAFKPLTLQFLKQHHGCPLLSPGLCAVCSKTTGQKLLIRPSFG